jgi:hypothetical protein
MGLGWVKGSEMDSGTGSVKAIQSGLAMATGSSKDRGFPQEELSGMLKLQKQYRKKRYRGLEQFGAFEPPAVTNWQTKEADNKKMPDYLKNIITIKTPAYVGVKAFSLSMASPSRGIHLCQEDINQTS